MQHGFDRSSPGHVNQFIHGQPRLFDQIDHWQQALPLMTEELRQPFRVR